MIENKLPIFEKGQIIDKEMLDLLRDNPLDLINLSYYNLVDGIIQGCDVWVEDNHIVIGMGIIKYSNLVLKIREDKKIKIPKESGDYYLKLRIKKKGIVDKKQLVKIDIILDEKEVEEDEIYISSFRKQEGTYLRYARESFKDFGDDYNMLNIIKSKFACEHKEGTLSPEILKAFAREVMCKKNLESVDTSFAMLSLNNKMKREVILSYISCKNGSIYRELDNNNIYNELYKILEKMGLNRVKEEKVFRRAPRMLID